MQTFTPGQRVEILSAFPEFRQDIKAELGWRFATYVRSSGDAHHVMRDDGEFTGPGYWAVSDSEIRSVADASAARLVALVDAWHSLGPNARRILEFMADRLVVGKAHGDFDKPRDWDKESAEEEIDNAMYRAAKALGMGKR